MHTQEIVVQLTARVMEVLEDLLCQQVVPDSFSDMEEEIRQAWLQIAPKVLELWLSSQDAPYPADELPCQCGGRARYEGRREGVLSSVLGTVHYKRAYYLCAGCRHGFYPLDQRLGLRPGERSALLESLLGMMGAELPFARATELFKRLVLISVSPQSVNDATELVGGEAMAVEEEWKRQSHDPKAIAGQEKEGREGKGEKRLYGTLDAVKLHGRERRDEEDDGWRDMKVGAWFVTEAKPPEGPEGEWEIEAKEITYYCDILPAQGFGELMWASGFQRGAMSARELVFVGDGAEWIWNLVQEHYPQAVQIVDWFHAVEHLTEVAREIPGEHSAQAWWGEVRGLLWAGEVQEVIRRCESLANDSQGGQEARRAAQYFRKHEKRMAYKEFREKGYQIGSGTVESECKQMGIGRMKVPGATWSTEGARRTAKARAAWLSGQWDGLTARRQHLRKAA